MKIEDSHSQKVGDVKADAPEYRTFILKNGRKNSQNHLRFHVLAKTLSKSCPSKIVNSKFLNETNISQNVSCSNNSSVSHVFPTYAILQSNVKKICTFYKAKKKKKKMYMPNVSKTLLLTVYKMPSEF